MTGACWVPSSISRHRTAEPAPTCRATTLSGRIPGPGRSALMRSVSQAWTGRGVVGIIGHGEGADGLDDVEGVAQVQAAGAGLADAEVCAGRRARAVRVGGGASARAGVGGSFERARAPELEETVLGGPLAAVDEAGKLRGGGGVGASEEAQGGLVRDREGVEVDLERA